MFQNSKKDKFKSAEEQLEILCAGTVDLIQKEDLLKKLKQKQSLVIKAGFDPSRPDIHFGHSVLINKLRQFQELGHQVYFIVGDFTACIGDPSGQNKTRPILSHKEAQINAKTYIQQVTQGKKTSSFDLEKTRENLQKKSLNHSQLEIKLQKIFQFFKKLNPSATKFKYNSQWLSRLSLSSFLIDIASQLTVARQLERNDFENRYKNQKPIGLHEFLYPILQAYDSYQIKADLEIGGTDQLFNLLLGRELQQHKKQSPQCVLTLPLLEGLDGTQKMSKSLDNYISYTDSTQSVYGKMMKISDILLSRYWEVFTEGDKLDTQQLAGADYKNLKQALAYTVVASLYSYKEADKTEQEFVKVFSKQELPSDIPSKTISPTKDLWIALFIKELGLCPSTSEAKRQIESGALKKDGKKWMDSKQRLHLQKGDEFLLSLGKRKYLKVIVK